MGLTASVLNTLEPIPMESSLRSPRNVRAHSALPLPRFLLQAAVRLLLAAALSAGLVALALTGMTVTSAPKWVSLSIEPFSLLLLPGAVFAWAEAFYNKLDFSGATVIRVSLLFYFFVFAFFLLARTKLAKQPQITPLPRNVRSR